MEEISNQLLIDIHILNAKFVLTKNDFLNLNQLVTEQNLQSFKLSFSVNQQQKIKTLNVFLYFIISIQFNAQIFQHDQNGHQYRLLCNREIYEYYINNKMKIQLYQFSFICAKIINIPVPECAHIIYFMIYGRFASHPYINSICQEEGKKKKLIINRKAKQNNLENMRSAKKRTLIGTQNDSDFQVQIFSKQLKHVLKSQQLNTSWIKQSERGNHSNFNRNQSQQPFSVNTTTERKSMFSSTSKHSNTFIPQRITQRQKSSIFQSLPSQSNLYKTCKNWNSKGLMRKQKFNEFFSIDQFKFNQNLRTKRKSPSYSTNLTLSNNNKQNHFHYNKTIIVSNDFNSNSLSSGKINYQNFKSISNELKSKNEALDKIRYECSIRNNFNSNSTQNTKILSQKGSNHQQTLSSQSHQQPLQDRKVDLRKIKTDSQEIKAGHQLNLSKKSSGIEVMYSPDVTLQYGSEKTTSPEFSLNLLRNDEALSGQDNENIKTFDYFTNSSNGLKKMNTKFKLQTYKSDYRKFIKTQLLDRIRQAIN